MCLVFLNCWNFWHCTYPKSSPFFSRDLGIGWKFEYLLQSLTSSKNHLYDLDDDAMLSLGIRYVYQYIYGTYSIFMICSTCTSPLVFWWKMFCSIIGCFAGLHGRKASLQDWSSRGPGETLPHEKKSSSETITWKQELNHILPAAWCFFLRMGIPTL